MQEARKERGQPVWRQVSGEGLGLQKWTCLMRTSEVGGAMGTSTCQAGSTVPARDVGLSACGCQ